MFFLWKFMFNMGHKRAEKREAAKAALLDTDDVRSIGPLLEALWLGDKMLRLQAEQALIRLLPRVRSSDAYRFNPERRKCLNHALNAKNSYLVLAAIQAVEQVGDASAIPILYKMSDKPAPFAMKKRIREAARKCLHVVEERRSANISSMLLRPAKEPMHSEQLLLASQVPSVPSSARLPPNTSERKG